MTAQFDPQLKIVKIKEFAKFDNIASFYPNENQNSKLSANNDFDNQGTYTIPSKMNFFIYYNLKMIIKKKIND